MKTTKTRAAQLDDFLLSINAMSVCQFPKVPRHNGRTEIELMRGSGKNFILLTMFDTEGKLENFDFFLNVTDGCSEIKKYFEQLAPHFEITTEHI